MSSRNPAPSGLPQFYSAPIALTERWHGGWRLKSGDAAFAAEATAIALIASDFATAARHYPILFTTGEQTAAIALVGLEGRNLFVENGVWAEGVYAPAYVRRYPFVLIEAPDQGGFSLAVDAVSKMIARDGDEGEPLFDDVGQPSPAALKALEFCRLFNEDHERTRAFCSALAQEDLLIDRQADVTLPDGRKLSVAGFKVVDPERFSALPDDKVLAWHRSGWLGLIHFHLASLERFGDLLNRQARFASSTEA